MQRGFTLFEVLVSIAILAVLIGLALPYLGGGVSIGLDRSAAEMATALRQTRSRAIAENGGRALTLDVDRRRYETADRQHVDLPRDTAMKFVTAESEIVAKGIAAVRFFPDGSSTGGNIVLRRGTESFRIDVNWLTGFVTVTRQ